MHIPDVEMKDASAGAQEHLDLLAETREIGRVERRLDLDSPDPIPPSHSDWTLCRQAGNEETARPVDVRERLEERGARGVTERGPRVAERIRLGVVEYAPTYVLDGIKSLSYGANMLCSRLARERGFDEALLVTPQGSVLEAPTSSLFWVDEFGSILTPPLSEHILASITRDRVMRVAKVEERRCTMDDLRTAGEAFLARLQRESRGAASATAR